VTGSRPPLVSIVITSHNYGRYLRAALDSALGQSYEHVEVIVVDDGSTDDSREILAGYGPAIEVIHQDQAGETVAVNTGVAAANGDLVNVLDADDVLLPDALERAVAPFADPEVTNVHWRLLDIDANGRLTGDTTPDGELRGGHLRDEILRDGPNAYCFPPNSGQLLRRRVTDAATPVPVDPAGNPDSVFGMFAALMGSVVALPQPLALYRRHGANRYAMVDFPEKVRRDLASHDFRCGLLAAYCRRVGVPAAPERWKGRSWVRRLSMAVADIEATLAAGETFGLLDEGKWEVARLPERTVISFPSRDGIYSGRPADDAEAVEELRGLRAAGARYLVVAWSAFWWLEHYRDLAARLFAGGPPVLANERVVIFELDRAANG
jgi:glycosyltransferase involved in cell wall biosynthesis